LRDFFNNKILTTEDIEALTDLPIIGHVIHNREKSFTVIHDFPMSQTTESIRAIRTNFRFIANERESNVILMTSSIMNEGKTFVSVNLALSFALIKKKTIVLNFDMRRPKLQDYLKIKAEKGLSVYLSGNATLDDIIVHTGFENLDVIMAGDIPPNPMELIASEYTAKLFQALKQTYDYIIVDSPPVGMVADSLLLVPFADVNIFVVRHNYTQKKILTKLVQNLSKREIHKINIVFNDVHLQRSYGYSYNYNYGYGYTNNSENSSTFKKIAGFFHIL
jgi:capsular exopolysaccharide synthesis family protein